MLKLRVKPIHPWSGWANRQVTYLVKKLLTNGTVGVRKAGTRESCRKFKASFFAQWYIGGKMLFLGTLSQVKLWIAALIWLQIWREVTSGDSKNVWLYEMAVQILKAKKSLRRTNQMSGSKKFCTAWNERLIDTGLDTNLASRLAMAVHRQHRLGQIVCPLVLYKSSLISRPRPSHWKAIIFVPESVRWRKLRHSESEVSQVPWLGRMQGTREKHAAMVFVCESVCKKSADL